MKTTETSSTIETAPAPGMPVAIIDDPFKDIWTLIFKQGQNPRSQYKNFRFSGTVGEACQKFRSHCEKTGKTFIAVTPFLSNFTEEEGKHLQS